MASHLVIFYVIATTSIVAAHSHASEDQLLRLLREKYRPRHCRDLLRTGQRNNGVYTIYHRAAPKSGQDVYCDLTTEGGGWTVIQRRGQYRNPVFHFYRNWSEYAEGFGNPNEEYWIGNKALHALTSGGKNMTLRIVLRNTTEDSVFIYYNNFRVQDEGNSFTLTIGDLIGPQGWDAMKHHNDQKFSTFDRDNDDGKNNCAEAYRGGWWYANCHACNPNGLNLNGFHESYADGIDWSVRNHEGRLYQYSFPYMEMMIRPAGMMQGKEKQLQFFPTK